MNTKRPLTLILALVLFALLTVFGLITPFTPNGPPLPIMLYAVIVAGVGGLIALFGLWKLKRWGLLLTMGIAALGILVAVPGLVIAPPYGKVISGVIIVVNALVLVLVALPATRKAFAAGAPAAQA